MAVFPEMASLLNSCVERTVILNDITQDNNKVLGDDINKTVKFHMLERSMEESVSTFQSMVEVEQQNCVPQQKLPLAEYENPSRRSNQEQGVDKYIKKQKGVEFQPIAVGFGARAESCGKNSI